MVVSRGYLTDCHSAKQNVVAGIDYWPRYGNGTSNFVFRTDQSYVESDTDRAQGVDYINTIVR
jgi:hypothetical protein